MRHAVRRRAGNNLAELRIHQEIRLAEIIEDMRLKGELRTSSDGKSKALDDPTLKLADFGITRFQLHRWNMERGYPKDMLEAFIAERTESEEGELTSGELYMRAKRLRKKVRNNEDDLPTEQYRVIYADPPWQYGNTLIVIAILHADQQEEISILAYFAGLAALALAVKPLSPMQTV